MAQDWRDDERSRHRDEGRRQDWRRDDERSRSFGPEEGRGYGYGGREGRGYEDSERHRSGGGGYGSGGGYGASGGYGRGDAGPVSGGGSPRWTDQDRNRGSGQGQSYGREADYGSQRSRGGFPAYGERVGYLDRGYSGGQGYGGQSDRGSGYGSNYGSASSGGYAGQQRGDYGHTPGGDYRSSEGGDFRSHQGGFSERESGQSYGTSGWETDETPTWRQLNRNHEGERYDQGTDRIGGMSAERGGFSGSRQGGYGGQWGAFGQSLSGPGRREEEGPHRGRGPKGWQRSDDRIRDDVHEKLADDPYVDASDIQVEVKSCEVTLTGFVDSREAKRRAEDCVERISGITHVQNNLRVRDDRSMGQSQGSGQSTSGPYTASSAAQGSRPGADQPLAKSLSQQGGAGAEAMSGGREGASTLSGNGQSGQQPGQSTRNGLGSTQG